MNGTIRQLFSTRRPIDRPIEKVIDYYAQEEERLAREIEEYEVTDNIEKCFRDSSTSSAKASGAAR